MVRATGRIAQKYGLDIGTFGHAGDGNLHPTILTDRRDKQEFARVEKAIEEIFDAALDLEGTLSGEHGIGLAKSQYMQKELNRGTMLYSRKIQKALDPEGILNPGKIFGD
jgi:glycolate oxidase